MILIAEALGLFRQRKLEELPALVEDFLDESTIYAMVDNVEEATVQARLKSWGKTVRNIRER